MSNPYDDIIDRPHHKSTTRPHMSAHDRAAQFSPFAALTGYDSAITETARLTDAQLELDESLKAELNEKLSLIQDRLDQQPEISITYFQADKKKSGGAYITKTGHVKKIDQYEQLVVMQDATKIRIEEILEIEGAVFHTLEP